VILSVLWSCSRLERSSVELDLKLKERSAILRARASAGLVFEDDAAAFGLASEDGARTATGERNFKAESEGKEHPDDTKGQRTTAKPGGSRQGSTPLGFEGEENAKSKGLLSKCPKNRVSSCFEPVRDFHACVSSDERRKCSAQRSARVKECMGSAEGSTVEQIQFRYGAIRFQVLDMYIGTALALYGEWEQKELALLTQLLPPASSVVDAGAHIGSKSIAFAQMVGPKGRVYSFEPQPELYSLLSANIALNGLAGVVLASQVGLGQVTSTATIPELLKRGISNTGQHALGMESQGSQRSQTETRAGRASYPDRRQWNVTVRALDDIQFQRLDLIKIDIQGMELDLLRGAQGTLQTHRPHLYLEMEHDGQAPELLRLLSAAAPGYKCFRHRVPIFNEKNYFGRRDNVFGGISAQNILCTQSTLALDATMEPLGPSHDR